MCGVVLRDTSGESERDAEVQAKVVINATGAWADTLRGEIQKKPRLRPLRGSHLVLPFNRLPLTRSVSFLHPRDGRPVFALPWEGAILFGTTDVDHGQICKLTRPSVRWRRNICWKGLQTVFPEQELTFEDVMSTFSGLRPVVNTGKANPVEGITRTRHLG